MMCVCCRRQWLDPAHGSQDGAVFLAEAAAEEAAAAAAMGVRRVGAVEDLRCLDEDLEREASAAASRYLEMLFLPMGFQARAHTLPVTFV